MTSSRSWNRRLRGCALALLLVAASAAQGAPRGKFLQRYQEGLKLYKAERYSEAIEVFQAAYALKQLPRVLFNIGQAHLKLGNAQEALRYYEQYLKLEPSPPPEIKSRLDAGMEQARASLAAAAPPEPVTPPPEPATAPPPEPVAAPAGPPPDEHEHEHEHEQEVTPLAPPVVVVQMKTVRDRRPIWRLATGGAVLAGGAALLGFGAGALAVNGQCIDPVLCTFDYATQPLGLGLVIGGVAVLGAGTVLIAWPGPRRRVPVDAAGGRRP